VPAIAGTAAAAAYLNAKFHIAKDVRQYYNIKMGERRVMKAGELRMMSPFWRCLTKMKAALGKLCLWVYFEEQVFRMPENEECIWSRTGCYTWRQTYDQVNRYSQFLLSQGINKGDLVGFYLTNSPEFMFAWLGTWGIGTAPAMINHHLAGEALIHCVKLSATKVLLVDWDEECVARIEANRPQIEELGIRIIILDDPTRATINSMDPIRPSDDFRKKMLPTFPMALIYTR
jgi:acyl-CoA synthetase (AMP-forming)/AMP-acid ligase II